MKKLIAEFKANGGKFKEFNIEDEKLLKCLSGRRKLTKLDLSKNGITPVYSSDSLNNGLVGYTLQKPDYIVNTDNPLYVIFGEHTKTMNIVKNSFCVMDNVKVLTSSITNIRELLYILTSWKKSIPDLGYARHWSAAKTSKFYLPLNNNEIDFSFMENYIRELEQERIRELEHYLKASGLDNYELTEEEQKALDLINSNKIKFKYYKINTLFDIHPTKSYKMTNKDLFETQGNTPVVTNSSINNGITGYVKLSPTEKGGIITYSDTTTSDTIFYQPNDFIGYPHIQGLYALNEKKWSEKKLLYFLTLFRKSANNRFNYANKFNRTIAKEMFVAMPINNTDNIDYNFMEIYIKAIEKLVIKNVVDWKDKIIKTTKDVCNK